jgi:hypothetical protein
MLSKHVIKLLSAYCNGELPAEESRRVSGHLLSCQRCRAEYEQIRAGARLAEQLATLQAPDGLWKEIEESLEPESYLSTDRAWFRLRYAAVRHPVVAVAAVLMVALLLGILLYLRRDRSAAWRVSRISGAPLIESEPIDIDSKLKVGQLLETGQGSRATLYPGSIGEVEIEPDSRLRLLQSRENEYRLSLERGEVKARVSAPPRLFFVNTPSAVAVDLGCAYTLDVDPQGNGHIDVTAGWVELDSAEIKSMVPAEAACLTRPGAKPGTPFFEDTSQVLKDALLRFDFGSSSPEERTSVLDTILSQSRKRDSLTVWHLLSRVAPQDRLRVYNRLAELVPPPEGVTSNGILQLDPEMLDQWFLEIQPAWFE